MLQNEDYVVVKFGCTKAINFFFHFLVQINIINIYFFIGFVSDKIFKDEEFRKNIIKPIKKNVNFFKDITALNICSIFS